MLEAYSIYESDIENNFNTLKQRMYNCNVIVTLSIDLEKKGGASRKENPSRAPLKDIVKKAKSSIQSKAGNASFY